MNATSEAPEGVARGQYLLDISGTLLSLLCAAHCLVLPLVLSWLSVKENHTGWLHVALLLAVIPIVGLALGRGYRNHKQKIVLWLGGIGVASLIFGTIWGHALHVEGAATVIGSLFVIAGHVFNIIANQEHCRCCQETPTTA